MAALLYILFAVIVYGAAAVLTYLISGADWQKFLYYITPAFGIATAFYAPLTLIFSARYQQELTRQLESLKNDFVRYNDLLKAEYARELEIDKALITGRVKAYDVLLTAAFMVYHALQSILILPLDEAAENKLLENAEARLAEASGQLWHFTDQEKSLWNEFYSKALHLFDVCLVMKDREERKVQWNGNGPRLGDDLNRLEEGARIAFAESERARRGAPALSRVGSLSPPIASRWLRKNNWFGRFSSWRRVR
jgi:hypothetical protein